MIILGPCPCQGCRRLVTWNGWEWCGGNRNWKSRGTHVCHTAEPGISDNTAVGSSGESNTIANGARVSATTRDAGVTAFRGSSS